MRKLYLFVLFYSIVSNIRAQENPPLFNDSGWSSHVQFTGVIQAHPDFHSPYIGQNSLLPKSERAFSITATMYIGRKLWKGASVYFNPEMAGGKGISSTLGIAGFPNGETFRVGNPEPTVYVGRFFIQQHFALGGDKKVVLAEGPNQVREWVPESRLSISAGKFCIADFFDNNSVSHDPRVDFMNWAFMNNGSYDYAANTRGYTVGLVVEYIKPGWALRLGTALMPTYANGPELDEHYFKSNSESIEYERSYSLNHRKGVIRLLGYFNVSKAPNYEAVVAAKMNGTDTSLDVIHGKEYGGKKFGLALNLEQELSQSMSGFVRLGWNDGKTASWAFAEIDNTITAGIRIFGSSWKRPTDNIGLALLSNGISSGHRDFLRAGGYGFMIGDGRLPNYTRENIAELFYQVNIFHHIWATLDYQFVAHPAYNRDRGPASIFAARVHFEW